MLTITLDKKTHCFIIYINLVASTARDTNLSVLPSFFSYLFVLMINEYFFYLN